MKFLANPIVFVVLYILLMLPTYFLPFLGSNSFVIHAAAAAADAGVNPAFWPHAACLLLLILIMWLRGSVINRKWLVIFPVLGAVFDMAPALNVIPLIPTVMHVLAIVLGVALKPDVTTRGNAPA